MGASVVKIPAALRRATPSEKIAIMGVVTASVGGALLLGGHHGLGAAILLAGIAIMSAAAPVAAIWSVLLLVPVHPLAMKTLQMAGVSGWPFLAVSAWKELALSVALVILAASAVKRARAQLLGIATRTIYRKLDTTEEPDPVAPAADLPERH